MQRRYISEYAERDTIDDVFLVSDKQLRSNRQGNLYLQVELSDRSGSIATRMWNATEQIAARFDDGDYVRAKGAVQLFQGGMQLIANNIDKAQSSEVDEQDFLLLTSDDIDRLALRLAEILRGLEDSHLVNLAECYLSDEAFMAKFTGAPAAVKHHHAYRGGLIDHTVNLCEVILAIAPRYPQVNKDLLLMGAFLHDSGKTEELYFDRGLGYSDHGQLIGHIVIGTQMLDAKAAEAEALTGEALPAELLLRVKHMIVSHHGTNEWGSPTVPMTLEAIALHYLDSLDAKIQCFEQLLHDDANRTSSWTQYYPNLGRKLFKGSVEE